MRWHSGERGHLLFFSQGKAEIGITQCCACELTHFRKQENKQEMLSNKSHTQQDPGS